MFRNGVVRLQNHLLVDLTTMVQVSLRGHDLVTPRRQYVSLHVVVCGGGVWCDATLLCNGFQWRINVSVILS
jgi:hypothetical protein